MSRIILIWLFLMAFSGGCKVTADNIVPSNDSGFHDDSEPGNVHRDDTLDDTLNEESDDTTETETDFPTDSGRDSEETTDNDTSTDTNTAEELSTDTADNTTDSETITDTNTDTDTDTDTDSDTDSDTDTDTDTDADADTDSDTDTCTDSDTDTDTDTGTDTDSETNANTDTDTCTDSDTVDSETELDTNPVVLILDDFNSLCDFDGQFEQANEGYEGIGYLNLINEYNNIIEWSVEARVAGNVTVEWKYCVGYEDEVRPAALFVNNNWSADIEMSSTGDWDTWAYMQKQISLVEGTNIIRLVSTSDLGIANLDTVTLTGVGISGGSCD